MKTIQSIPTWVKGQAVTATIFNLRPIGGELFKSATFYYALLDDALVVVADGSLSLSGEEYEAWGDNDNYPFEWAAEKLNLVITGDYVAPVIEPIVEQTVQDSLTVETDSEI